MTSFMYYSAKSPEQYGFALPHLRENYLPRVSDLDRFAGRARPGACMLRSAVDELGLAYVG